jgi:hypothetical protein
MTTPAFRRRECIADADIAKVLTMDEARVARPLSRLRKQSIALHD